jgi:hypothetical protein
MRNNEKLSDVIKKEVDLYKDKFEIRAPLEV